MRGNLTRRDLLLGVGALAGTATLATRGRAHAAATVGQAAPDFTSTTTSGSAVSLADQRSKIVVLEWTNHECPYVRKHYESGNMQALQREARGKDVVWLSLISSAPRTQGYVTAAEADELTRSRQAVPTAVLLDPKGTVGRMYDARVTPHMYVIDRQGLLVYAGAIDDRPTTRKSDIQGAQNYVRAALESVMAGQPVKTPVTRAYGCTVKYS
ncbi:MAG TPA: redoxin domain-containing protein [Methylomirabilota bacterium]|nr:redoxin domain-containing protein [Methylomirabilota bacterium]